MKRLGKTLGSAFAALVTRFGSGHHVHFRMASVHRTEDAPSHGTEVSEHAATIGPRRVHRRTLLGLHGVPLGTQLDSP